MRLPLLPAGWAVVLALACEVASAQRIPCVGGTASGYPCRDVDLMARLPLGTFVAPGYPAPTRASEVWGWTDPDTGREYALFGITTGVAFVNVTDPEAPVYLGLLPAAVADPVGGRWRLVRVYGTYAFTGSETSGHGVQVFDLTRLRDVPNPPVVFTHDARYTGAGVGRVHTLVVLEETGYLFLAGSNTCAGGLHIVDVRSPLTPTFAGCFSADGYVHEAQCLVYDGPDADHQGRELCVGYNEDHIAFIDVTDKANPALISTATYPDPGYTHQGWFTEDRRHLLVDDEGDEQNGSFATARTIIMDVEDLDNPEFLAQHLSALPVVDHNQYVVGRYTFQSNDEGGLRILDLSEVASGTLTEVAYFDTYPEGQSPLFTGQWMNYPFFASKNVIASDRTNGLFVLRPTALAVEAEPGAPAEAFALSAPSPNPASGAAVLTLTLGEAQRVRAEAYDALGRRVASLHDGPLGAGTHRLTLDGSALPAGVYVVRVSTEEGATLSRTVSLLR